jgi:O-antigen/teichoic acid export membrane protein
VSVKKNVIANYVGQGWTALMGLIFVPQYIRYLGMESYGLIGVFALLQSWLSLLNLGLTPTLTREMARFTAGAHTPQSIRDLFHSLSLVVWALALLIAGGLWLAADWLAASWLHADRLPLATVAQAISVMGIVIALKFMEGLYQGAIIGLQRQVWLNAASAMLATLRGVGAIAVLRFVAPTLGAFFIWQGIVSLVTVASYLVALRRWLPAAPAPVRYSSAALSGVKGFAGGMLLTSLLSILLLSTDKLLLTRMLSLEAFGQYSLAASVAAVIYQLVTPVNQAFYPRLTELVSQGDGASLAKIYHSAAQVVSVMVAPAALTLVLYGEEILLIWTGNPALSRAVAPLLSLLVVGNSLHCMMYVPYSLQLAHGWTSFANYLNSVAVVILVPAILWAVPIYGARASAWTWVSLTSGYVLFSAHFMHRRLLVDQKWRWYLHDLLLPALAALAVIALSRTLYPPGMAKPMEGGWLCATWLCSLAAALVAIPEGKDMLLLGNRLWKLHRTGAGV